MEALQLNAGQLWHLVREHEHTNPQDSTQAQHLLRLYESAVQAAEVWHKVEFQTAESVSDETSNRLHENAETMLLSFNYQAQELLLSNAQFDVRFVAGGVCLMVAAAAAVLYDLRSTPSSRVSVPSPETETSLDGFVGLYKGRPHLKFLLCGTLVHILSLSSTSFIENEHATWFWLCTSVCVLLISNR